MLRAAKLAAALACAGCALQQTTTTEIQVRDPSRVVVRVNGATALAEGAEARSPAPGVRVVQGWMKWRDVVERASGSALRRDEGAIVLDLAGDKTTLVSSIGYVQPGHEAELDAPDEGAPMHVEVTARVPLGECRSRGRYRSCPRALWYGALETPWQNVRSVRQHVEPIGKAWASFDITVGVVLGLVAASFAAPPHARRPAAEDAAIGAAIGVPALLALVNGVWILARSPSDRVREYR